jgi:hypothetical protein
LGRRTDREDAKDAGLTLLKEIKKLQIAKPPPIIIFASHLAVEKYGKDANDNGAMLATASLRELTKNMDDVLRKSLTDY